MGQAAILRLGKVGEQANMENHEVGTCLPGAEATRAITSSSSVMVNFYKLLESENGLAQE